MRAVVFLSSGAGSWKAGRRTVAMFGRDHTQCLFTDTLIEDDDNYRALLEMAHDLLGGEPVEMPNLPWIDRPLARLTALRNLADEAMAKIPGLVWLIDGRDPWQVFFDARFLGNSRVARCSHELKQDTAREWVHTNCHPYDTELVVGVDWTEDHRAPAIVRNWKPYRVWLPLMSKPLVWKPDVLNEMRGAGIEPPRLYADGYAHANCGGFCVRAGHGQFAVLLEKNPRLFAYHEQREREIREYLDSDVAILRDRTHGESRPLTLQAFRARIEADQGDQLDLLDFGGCGCFIDEVAA